jgi:hypothetical protein
MHTVGRCVHLAVRRIGILRRGLVSAAIPAIGSGSSWRTSSCAAVTSLSVGSHVQVAGIVAALRVHGGVTFITLRDAYGSVQVVVTPETAVSCASVEGESGGRGGGNTAQSLLTASALSPPSQPLTSARHHRRRSQQPRCRHRRRSQQPVTTEATHSNPSSLPPLTATRQHRNRS